MDIKLAAYALATGEATERGRPIYPGRRLRLWRALTDTCGYEIASALQVSYGTLMRYERGMRVPTEEVTIRLKSYFGFRW